jgi:hypothetical protein
MRFFIEVPPLTGMTDVMDVQFIGQFLGDGDYVVEAATEVEAKEKLLDLFTKRVDSVEFRPATEYEAAALEERQYEGYEIHESAVRIHEKYAKGLGNEQAG